jgi:hypothetical protein
VRHNIDDTLIAALQVGRCKLNSVYPPIA